MENQNTPTTPDASADGYNSNRATYCPEDNKLRLYVGRVPRDEYEALRKQGWTSTPKQECDFVAIWTPDRRDTALDYAGVIEDEDQSPAERAADRAERFADYREKRRAEAGAEADHYDSGPSAFGYQSQARADRAARRHDRFAARAVDAWDKAEYWQRRTAGVISHALHLCAPSVRMGRIKDLESEIRKAEKARAEYETTRQLWQAMTDTPAGGEQARRAYLLAGGGRGYWQEYAHPDQTETRANLCDLLHPEGRPKLAGLRAITPTEAAALYLARNGELSEEGDWLTHYRLRLAYELQMLEAQGGRAGVVEMERGGLFNRRAIAKINRSPKTGRVVSVAVIGPRFEGWTYQAANEPGTAYALYTFDAERAAPEAYEPPTDASRAQLAEFDAARAAAAAKKPPAPPLINPTDADAERLQELVNATAANAYYRRHLNYVAPAPARTTQAVYSANSKGGSASAETAPLCALGIETKVSTSGSWEVFRLRHGPTLCQVRTVRSSHGPRVVILTDKPQKPLPTALWSAYPGRPTPEQVRPLLGVVAAWLACDWTTKATPEQLDAVNCAHSLGWVSIQSITQRHWTDAGIAELRAFEARPKIETQAAFELV